LELCGGRGSRVGDGDLDHDGDGDLDHGGDGGLDHGGEGQNEALARDRVHQKCDLQILSMHEDAWIYRKGFH
jgi:hypothetical protein